MASPWDGVKSIHFTSLTETTPMTHLTWHDFLPPFLTRAICKKDMIAMSDDTDPFACEGPRHEAWAMWFAELYTKFGFTQGVHLRRIHYVLMSQETYPMVGSCAQNYATSDVWVVPIQGGKKAGEKAGDVRPNVYKNDLDCWTRLVKASRFARWLGLVDAHAFNDQRNPAPMLFDEGYKIGAPDPVYGLRSFDFDRSEAVTWNPIDFSAPDAPDMPRLEPANIGHACATQTHVLEIWVEKSTMNDVLIPLCRRHGVNLVYGVGETSITAIHALGKRLKEYDKPARILYISDLDPGGMSMPMAAARKLEALIREELPELEDNNVTVERLMLTVEQALEYNLPPVPLKEGERRAAKFQQRHGLEGGVELDALEALHPGVFRRIVEAAILEYRAADKKYAEELKEFQREMRRRSDRVNDELQEEFGERIEDLALDYEAMVDRYKRITEWLSVRFDRDRQDWIERARPVHVALKAAAKNNVPDIEDMELPEPDLISNESAFYDSERSYPEQIESYKEYKLNAPFELSFD